MFHCSDGSSLANPLHFYLRRFRFFSKKTALLGFVWCLVLSFLISWLMALLALLLLYAIFKYINISSQQQGPGTSRRPR